MYIYAPFDFNSIDPEKRKEVKRRKCRHIFKPLLSIYSLSSEWSGFFTVFFLLFLLPQVPSLLFFFISVTVPEVHKSRSVSANMLLVT